MFDKLVKSLSKAPISGVLSGVRVLAGPFCTMLLADLGAEVIKIKRPDIGDETRRWGPPFITPELSSCYASVNRNKKSIVIDLKHEKGSQLLLDLVGKSDVLIENYIPGKLDAMGIGYKDCKKANDNLIYASITGFVSSGPYAERPGVDVIASSIAGLISITGPEGGEPCKTGVALTDLVTGLYAKSAVLAALFHREMSGKGCRIECDLLSSQVSTLTHLASNYLNNGQKAKRWGTAHESIVPYQAFKCSDGKWITIGAVTDPMFGKLCRLLAQPKVAEDQRYKDNASRVKNRESLIRLIQSQIASKPLNHWLKLFDNSGFAYGPVNDLEDVFKDPQVMHNKSVVWMDSELNGVPKIKTLGHAVNYQSEDLQFVRQKFSRPPLLAEHTKRVLKSVLNYPDIKIRQLLEENVIQSHSRDK